MTATPDNRIAIGIDGIWREFDDVCDCVDFAFFRCLGCGQECKGRFCRSCYRRLPADQKRRLVDSRSGKIIGYKLDE